MLKEYDDNYWRPPCERHRLLERISHIGACVQIYARASGERKPAWMYLVWMTISWEADEIDTRSYMIDHHWRIWYLVQKLPKLQQWSLMGWACGVHKELGELECSRTWKYSEYDRLLGCLQVRYTDAMAMAMMRSERKSPSMPPSQDKAHTMIADFNEITVSNSDDELHIVRGTNVRFDGRMPDIAEVEIWRTMSLWMFLLSLLFTSLLHWISAQYKWRWQGFLPPPEICQLEMEFPLLPDLLKACPEPY